MGIYLHMLSFVFIKVDPGKKGGARAGPFPSKDCVLKERLSRPHFEVTSKGTALDPFKGCVLEGFSKRFALGKFPRDAVPEKKKPRPAQGCGAGRTVPP